jgi:hypothetical protein
MLKEKENNIIKKDSQHTDYTNKISNTKTTNKKIS